MVGMELKHAHFNGVDLQICNRQKIKQYSQIDLIFRRI